MGDVITGIDFAARRDAEANQPRICRRVGETADGIPVFEAFRPDETAPSEYVAPDDDCA